MKDDVRRKMIPVRGRRIVRFFLQVSKLKGTSTELCQAALPRPAGGQS